MILNFAVLHFHVLHFPVKSFSGPALLIIHVPMVKYEMLRQAVKCGLSDVREGSSAIRDTVRSRFVQNVQL